MSTNQQIIIPTRPLHVGSHISYYNEFDPKKVLWLKQLIECGVIAYGHIDPRSITEVQPDDLMGYTQCHFFAGIGVWSYAFNLAGVRPHEYWWSASCPCQPFSVAGKRKGTSDERHLFPELMRLVRECNPDTVVGEQVANGGGLAWIDDVFTQMESENYAVGAVPSSACGYGSPQIRQRMYWVADSNKERYERDWSAWGRGNGFEAHSAIGGVAHSNQTRPQGRSECGDGTGKRVIGASGVADQSNRLGSTESIGRQRLQDIDNSGQGELAPGYTSATGQFTSATNGFWSNPDWVLTRPERLDHPPSLRPVEPGSFPLVARSPQRVLRLRGYGDAIVLPQAVEFIKAYREIKADLYR